MSKSNTLKVNYPSYASNGGKRFDKFDALINVPEYFFELQICLACI